MTILAIAFVHLLARAPQEPTAGEVRKNDKGLEFCYVPEGGFTMGPGPEKGNLARKVTLDAYWITKNEVTVAQFYTLPQHFHAISALPLTDPICSLLTLPTG